MGFFSDLFGRTQAKAAKEAAKIQAQTAREGMDMARGYTDDSLAEMDTALGDALGHSQQAADIYRPYADVGQQSLTQLSNLYGLNGQEAAQTAMQGFETSPGYQFRLDQGVQALDRSAAASGSLYSGRQGKALTEYGQGVGSQEYGNYISGLSGLMSQGYQGAQGLSGVVLGQGDAIMGNAANRANIRSGGMSAALGQNTQIGQAEAGGVLGAANARAAGANNVMGLITTGAQMAMGIPPGSFGGGGGGGPARYMSGPTYNQQFGMSPYN
jgi:hypothetical protein